MFLETINSPSDVKKLNKIDCVELAREIRCALVTAVSKTGGHLSSNLGIVEAAIALHYVFESPRDKIIFDTSHQCYTHKMLTGRKEAYMNPECYKKNSGYTNPEESEHDYYKFGHTSTSISLACGMAKARDLKGDKENIIAVIGDASLGGGQALAGLNYGGAEIKGNLIILLNDNQMSIAENHGGLYKNLENLRKTKGADQHNIFKLLGYDYLYLEEGNDVMKVIDILERGKNINHPIVIHICTMKGKGFELAEKYKEDTHFIKPFDINAKEIKKEVIGERYDIIVRDYLMEKMKKDRRIVAITAAMPVVLSFSEEIRAALGEQYIDVGITEEHAISMAGGIARNGGKPVFFTRATFYQRTYDQISQELCMNKLPVTMILLNSSVYAPTDMTHIGIFDIAMLSNIPNMVLLAPTNKQEYLAMLEWSIEQDKYPVAIRAPRNGVYYADGAVDRDYSDLNRFKKVIEGERIAIIALGDVFQMGEELAVLIKKNMNIIATLVNPRFATGIDKEMLDEISQSHEMIVTLEDGIIEGGFGQKVAGFCGKYDIQVLNYGLEKAFFDNYDVDAVLNKNHLKSELILEEIINTMIMH